MTRRDTLAKREIHRKLEAAETTGRQNACWCVARSIFVRGAEEMRPTLPQEPLRGSLEPQVPSSVSLSVLRRSTLDFFFGPPQSTTHCHYTAQLHPNLTRTPTGHFFLGAPKKEAMEVWPFLDAVLA